MITIDMHNSIVTLASVSDIAEIFKGLSGYLETPSVSTEQQHYRQGKRDAYANAANIVKSIMVDNNHKIKQRLYGNKPLGITEYIGLLETTIIAAEHGIQRAHKQLAENDAEIKRLEALLVDVDHIGDPHR